MSTLDELPQPAPEYDPHQFLQDFLFMDAVLGAIESKIENAQKAQEAKRLASAIEEGKKVITRMLEFLAETYKISDGRIEMSPVFKTNKLNFPYHPPELWEIVRGEKAPYHDDIEPELEISEEATKMSLYAEYTVSEAGPDETAEDISAALTKCLEEIDK